MDDLKGVLGLHKAPESQERRAIEIPRAIALVEELLVEARQELAEVEMGMLRVEGSLAAPKGVQKLSDYKIRTLMALEPAWVRKKAEAIQLTATVQRLEGYRRALMEESRLLQAVFGYNYWKQRQLTQVPQT